MYVHGVLLGVEQDWIFVEKIKSFGWGETDVFIFEDLHSSLHKKSVLFQKRRIKGARWGGIRLKLLCEYLKSDYLEKGGHKQDQCLF